MAEDDPLKELRELAEAGEKVFGPEDKQRALFEHHCRRGDWFTIGALAATAFIYFSHVSLWWVAPIAVVIGYVMNEAEARRVLRQVRAEIAAER